MNSILPVTLTFMLMILLTYNAVQFLSLLDHANLTQHVLSPTHRNFHTLDLAITSANSASSPTVISLPISPDHNAYHVFIANKPSE